MTFHFIHTRKFLPIKQQLQIVVFLRDIFNDYKTLRIRNLLYAGGKLVAVL